MEERICPGPRTVKRKHGGNREQREARPNRKGANASKKAQSVFYFIFIFWNKK
jgi:hypothetical protein